MKKSFIVLSLLVLAFLLSSCLGPQKATVSYKVSWSDSTSITNGDHEWYFTAALDPEISYNNDNSLPTSFVYNQHLTPDTTLYSSASFDVQLGSNDSVVMYVYKDLNDNKKLDGDDLIGGYDHVYGNDYDSSVVKFFVNF